MYVIPKNGLLIRDPDRDYQFLPPGGANVSDSTYWRRRIADGDVTVGESKKVTSKKAEASA